MNSVTLIIGLGIFFFLLTCWAILDVARKDFGSIEKKAMWGVIAWIPFIGFVVYFLFGAKKGQKDSEGQET